MINIVYVYVDTLRAASRHVAGTKTNYEKDYYRVWFAGKTNSWNGSFLRLFPLFYSLYPCGLYRREGALYPKGLPRTSSLGIYSINLFLESIFSVQAIPIQHPWASESRLLIYHSNSLRKESLYIASVLFPECYAHRLGPIYYTHTQGEAILALGNIARGLFLCYRKTAYLIIAFWITYFLSAIRHFRFQLYIKLLKNNLLLSYLFLFIFLFFLDSSAKIISYIVNFILFYFIALCANLILEWAFIIFKT